MADTNDSAVAASFARPRFEIIPMKGLEQQLPYLPADAVVTVTSSPTRGLDATLTLSAALTRRENHRVVPHIPARLVRDRSHLTDLMDQLHGLGLEEIFVIAGDAAQPAGPFNGAVDLLRAMAEIGHDLQIGVTGYPESHAFIPDDTTIQAMFAKEAFASYVVSQICYDPAVIARWVAAVRERGTQLPIYVGLPGAVDFAKLLRVSRKVGIGDSMRYVRKQWADVAKLIGGYRPDKLVDGLAATVGDPAANIAGWHLFTFNEIRNTEVWRRQTIDRYARTTT